MDRYGHYYDGCVPEKFDPTKFLQEKLDAVMPWVGLYIAAASAICTLAMAADAFNGFRLKKFWFPCKFFSLNAASLTLLAVAMKLPVDLTTIMIGKDADFFAKLSSLIFMSTAMANFMSSLGSMNDKNILANVVALGILVITIVANVWIQFIQLWRGLTPIQIIMPHLVPTILMLVLLATLVSLAVTAPTTKRNLELKYQEKHKEALRKEEALKWREAFGIDNKSKEMMKYWVMAETSSPQFVMARSVVCSTSAVICLLNAIILAGTYYLVLFLFVTDLFETGPSVYGSSAIWIQVIQTIGVAVGTIAPTFRWFVAVGIKCSTEELNSFEKLFLIKNFLITSNNDTDLSRYVLLLEGEAELPTRVLKDIRLRADDMIERGRKKQPKNLVVLLRKFENFNGVGQFDSNETPSLHGSQKHPNCWTLPVVTLTGIAIALPNIAEQKRKELVDCVTEGLSLAETVDSALDENAQLVNIRKAAVISWVGVVLINGKCLDMNPREKSHNCKNSKEVLRKLSDKAKAIIDEFKKEVKDSLMENPLNWPAKVVAANSMYRISETILWSCDKEENKQTDKRLFEQLSVMIAEILAACLTNLPHAITAMCHRNTIEKREESVRKAFLLLGKTEQVFELLQNQQQKWPISQDHDKAAYNIEEWRVLFPQDKDDSAASSSTSSDAMVTTHVSSEDHLAIAVDC